MSLQLQVANGVESEGGSRSQASAARGHPSCSFPFGCGFLEAAPGLFHVLTTQATLPGPSGYLPLDKAASCPCPSSGLWGDLQ